MRRTVQGPTLGFNTAVTAYLCAALVGEVHLRNRDPAPPPAQFAGQGVSTGKRQLDFNMAIASRHAQHRSSLDFIWFSPHGFLS